ncbi:MAG: TonB-dependent receptor plug domain-containing protein [Candidatus Aminicenantes bacterium]|nr:TonB-dependent receptor plug domain-containing protein [Candidatus Aminicenantes bacterium]
MKTHFSPFRMFGVPVLCFALLAPGSILGAGPQEKAGAAETQKEEKPYQLENIVIDVVDTVRSRRNPNMTVIKPEFFPQSLGTSLDTALERQPGVDVQRIQEIGSALDDDSIRIRGFGARRIAVARDGRLLNTSGVAGGYFIDWTMIPLSGIERIEIVKGVSDARTGNVLGGVINLVSRKPAPGPAAVEAQAGASSFDTWSLSLYHGSKPGRFDYSLSSNIEDSAGYLSNGTFSFKNAGLRMGYDLPFAGRLSAEASWSRVKKGFIVANRAEPDFGAPGYDLPADPDFPASDGEYMYGGMGAYPEPGSYWIKNKWLFSLAYEQGFGASGYLRLAAWKNHGDREAFNTRRSLDRVFHKKFFDDRSFGASAEYSRVFGSHSLKAGIDFSRLKDDGDANLADDFRAPFRNGYYVQAGNLAAYLTADFSLVGRKLVLTPGVRWMSYQGIAGPGGVVEGIPDIRLRGLAPAVKLTWIFSDENFLYLSLARALRFPTAPEHYWHYDADDAGVDTSGLPFREEDGLLLQGGWTYAASTRTRFELSSYYYAITDYIQFDLINFVAYNIDTAGLFGLEAEVSHRLSRGVSFFANYTFSRSRTSGDTFVSLFVNPGDLGFREIPGIPAHKGNAGVKWQFPNNARLALFVQAVSGMKVVYNGNALWTDDLRVVDQPGYVRLDFEAAWPLPRLKARLTGFVRNILNARYQERFGFPSAGRTAGISAKFTL